MSTRRLPSTPRLACSARCTWQSPRWHWVETALSALCSQVLLSLGCTSASENLTAKCTSGSFNSSPPKSIFKSALSCCAPLGRLENRLRRTWARVGEAVFAKNTTVFALNITEFAINTTVFHQILLYLPPNTTVFSKITTVCAQHSTVFSPKYCWNTTTFVWNTTMRQNTDVCDSRPCLFSSNICWAMRNKSSAY